ncbi:hypothetical protein F2Q69_00042858 [Brassica cretica]|uniref:Uncharacterized protein n=1 Tax=Brassica cretica TaxID=69181 RepID=A0A8S9NBV5_BRACR|nr:hypothetical protein F2Q69_00042858 [Brassica cretica]
MTCSFLKNLFCWNSHSGCSALSRTVTRVAPQSGTVTQTVPRENLQIALCSVLFVPAGLSPIQCNSRPRPSSVHAWLLRWDRAWLVRVSIAILELVLGCCETVERFLLHQSDQSGFDFIVLSSVGRRIDGGARGGKVTWKVPLSDGSALLLDLLSSEVSSCLASSFLCVDCLLHLMHLLLNERHCSSEIILASMINHCVYLLSLTRDAQLIHRYQDRPSDCSADCSWEKSPILAPFFMPLPLVLQSSPELK